MGKSLKRIFLTALCVLWVFTVFAAPVFAATEDYTVTVRAETDNVKVKPGDIVTVSVTVSGARFCGAQMDLTYDADRFEYISTMAGWKDSKVGKLSYMNANASGGYWQDGKVLGTFKFAVKENAPKGKATFGVGTDSKVYIVGAWSEGASSEAPTPLKNKQIENAKLKIAGGNDGDDTDKISEYGAFSDDGNTVKLEPGNQVICISDTDFENVVWSSSNDKIASVDKKGVVTAVAEGNVMISAKDESGNEVEQREIVVGTAPADISTAEDENGAEESSAKTATNLLPIIAIVVIAIIIATGAVVIIRKKQQDKKE